MELKSLRGCFVMFSHTAYEGGEMENVTHVFGNIVHIMDSAARKFAASAAKHAADNGALSLCSLSC